MATNAARMVAIMAMQRIQEPEGLEACTFRTRGMVMFVGKEDQNQLSVLRLN